MEKNPKISGPEPRPDGLIPQPHGGALRRITSEQAREMRLRSLERRREELRRAALDALDVAARQLTDLSSDDRAGVLRAIFANHALNAHDPSARGSVASARLVLEHAYPEPRRERGAAQVAAAAAGQALGSELARRLLAALRAAQADGGSD